MSRVLALLAVLLAALPAAAQDAAAQDAAAQDAAAQDATAQVDAPRYEAWTLPGYAVPAGVDSTAVRPPDPWLGRDKVLHVGASFLLTLSGQYVLVSKLDTAEGDAWPLAAAGALAVGVLKEVADSRRARNPLFSWRDLAADAVGVALGLGLIWL